MMPFQAFAANVLRACGSSHQGMSMVASAMDHGNVSDISDGAGMDQPSAQDDHCPEMASSSKQSSDTSTSIKHGSCSACAACSVGAFAPPQLLTFKPSFINAEVYEPSALHLSADSSPTVSNVPPALRRLIVFGSNDARTRSYFVVLLSRNTAARLLSILGQLCFQSVLLPLPRQP